MRSRAGGGGAVRLQDRVVILTGASRGIGRALARRLFREGCRLVLVARSRTGLAELAETAGFGNSAALVSGDVADPATASRAVGEALARFGRVDILVNNAGVGLRAPVAGLDPDDFRRVVEVNVAGALNFIRETVPHLVDRGEGLVVNMASVVARQTVPFLGGYAATKAALVALSDALRVELSGTGVGVLTVLPGSVETGFRAAARGEPYPERAGAVRLSPEQVAEEVVRAMRSGRPPRNLYILSRGERLGLFLGRLFPRLVEAGLMRRYGTEGGMGTGPPGGPGRGT